MHRAFWSMVSSFGTTFAQIFLRLKFSVIIFHTQFRLMFSSNAVIRIVNRRSPLTICLTGSTFASVLLVKGLPLFASSSRSSRSFLNHLHHSKHVIVTLHLFHKFAAAMSERQMGFYPTGPKILDLLVAQCSSLHNFVFLNNKLK